MTPRAGVKEAPATERAFQGPPIPSGGPFFLGKRQFQLLFGALRTLSAATNTEERSPLSHAQSISASGKPASQI
jgi:hypothetical protein